MSIPWGASALSSHATTRKTTLTTSFYWQFLERDYSITSFGGISRRGPEVRFASSLTDNMKNPNFFIIGAPKCGTTSLYFWLLEHNKIFMPNIKEPHFFASELKSRKVQTLSRYKKLFENANDNHLAVGEASTGYLFSQEAVPRIESRYSGVKYIVMLRNPIDMAQSLHEQEIRCGAEHVRDFETAWRLSPERRRGREVHFGCESPKRLDYMNRCSLGSQLERLLSTVSRSRVLILFLEDIRKESRNEYEKSLDFLSVPTDNRSKFPVRNESKEVKYPTLRRLIRNAGRVRNIVKSILGIDSLFGVGAMSFINEKSSSRKNNKSIDKELETEMCIYFEKDVSKVESITGRDLSQWIKIDDG